MAVMVNPQSLQKIEFDATTAEGPCRVTIVTGRAPINLSGESPGAEINQKESYKILLDPTLEPGQFRKATASVSWAGILQGLSGTPATTGWIIEDAQASLDDETNRIQLVVDVWVLAKGLFANANGKWLNFQVTTLAMVKAPPPTP
jgi:hypothetical protein